MRNYDTQGVVLNSTRTRFILVGVALGAALLVFVGCPDGATPIDGASPIDRDGDRLIDINTIDDLNAMRHNLAGTSYQASADSTEVPCGTDADTVCIGYELTRDLDFADGDSYASGTVNAAWRPTGGNPDSATNPGWTPIGTGSGADSFSGMFSGNGFAIANLYVRRDGNVGLFGRNTGTIQRIGVVDVSAYGGRGNDSVGGLVGFNNNTGTITASYATGNVYGGVGIQDDLGGLVGSNNGTITASYATGDVDGGGRTIDDVGGLVGNNRGTITASYATGNVAGGVGHDSLGGLVGISNDSGTTTASYATGNIDGRGGTDYTGGLLGFFRSTATNSSSYGFGTVTGGSGVTSLVVTRSGDASPPAMVANACAITRANSSTRTSNRWSTAQWDFGTAAQRPIVLHNGNPVPGQTDRGC